MCLGGIGVFIKLIQGERATQGEEGSGTQILFHTHHVFDVESTCLYSPLHSLFSRVTVIALCLYSLCEVCVDFNIIEEVIISMMLKKSVEKQ